MGNNPSTTASKAGSPPPTTSTPSSGHESPIRQHRKDRSDGRSFISHHATSRSAAPPEASLAQAQGSTGIVSRPKSIPPTAVSSLSGSPHSSSSAAAMATTTTISNPTTTATAAAAASKLAREHDEPSKPVDVPHEASSLRSQPPIAIQSDAAQLVSHGSITDMYLTRPPRLPLPIEEEVHTPGSPILAAEDNLVDVPEPPGSTEALTRKSSALSTATADEDESEELRVDRTRPVVGTKIEWKRGGEKVYVTGTIFQWNRKHRLLPVEGKPGCFAATIYILPGTHHLRFLVDGTMQTSPDLPTTVDFGNNLVNYIEVNPDDAVHKQRHAATKSATQIPMETPSRTSSQSKDHAKAPKGKAVAPRESYRSAIPQYLVDFDQAEESPAYQNALAALEKLPNPPSLPGFLGKPILNAATLMKDDNSVLNMPNHTVLNHLATSSIKNNVLAVSATTRYRNKYVTTIMYKPTSTDG